MLSDTERKLLRIIFNQHRHDWHRPDLGEMGLRSQRDIKLVRQVMRKLRKGGYIEVKDEFVKLVRTE